MNLLLAIDASTCSEAALQTVIDAFRPLGATVRVLHVIDWCHELSGPAAYAEGPSAGRAIVTMEEELRRCRRDLVAHAVARLVHAGFTASAHLAEGERCEEILAMAARWPSDVIVVGSHNRHGTDRLLGSISDRVSRRAACSVLIVKTRTIPHSAKYFPIQIAEPLA